MIGLYKTEFIAARKGPWRGLGTVEHQTLVWVPWFNKVWLLSTIGYLPPAAYEELFERPPAGIFVLTSRASPSLLQTRGGSLRVVKQVLRLRVAESEPLLEKVDPEHRRHG